MSKGSKEILKISKRSKKIEKAVKLNSNIELRATSLLNNIDRQLQNFETTPQIGLE